MNTKAFRPILFIVCALSGIGSANAAVIISDSFTGTGGSTLTGRTPDSIDLPSRTYSTTDSGAAGFIDLTTGNPSANTNFNSAAFIDISSTGGYTKPALLTLSVDLQMNSIQDDGSLVRGIGLGFFSAAPNDPADASTTFTGLTVRPNGSLQLVKQGVQQPTLVAAFPGFSVNSFYTLAYSIDTNTGSITSVSFNGNDDTATFSGAASVGTFTPAITNEAGFYGDTANSTGLFGRADNFSVSTVPEPTAALLGILGIFSLVSRRVRDDRNG